MSAASDRERDASSRGSRAAWAVFGVFAVVELVLAVSFQGDNRVLALFAGDLAMAVGAPVAALVVHFVLPRESRRSFWITGAICAALTVLLWGGTCSIAASSASASDARAAARQR
jgi:hypothetical protein